MGGRLLGRVPREHLGLLLRRPRRLRRLHGVRVKGKRGDVKKMGEGGKGAEQGKHAGGRKGNQMKWRVYLGVCIFAGWLLAEHPTSEPSAVSSLLGCWNQLVNVAAQA